jgi:pyruvate,orthophosphate dikinase
MLGLRACRFGLISPEVYDLQIKAIVRAAYEAGNCVNPGIMFPLVLFEAELATLKDRVLKIEAEIREKLEIPEKGRIVFRVGSMIELPAAALGADRLARIGEFFAFGTNDLTQTTLGMSRDDSAHYLPHYLEKGFLDADPFKALSEPVKELIEMAVSRGRRVRPDASFGICGEQGGNIATIRFCLENGLDYISCSPFRVLSAQVSLIRVCLTEKIRAESNGFRTLSTSNKDASGPSLRLVQAG